MIRSLKLLGALGAILVLTAAVASAASAAKYTASGYPTTATGESAVGNDVFKTEAGNSECKTHYEAPSLTAASLTLTMKTKTTSCKTFGFLESTVSMGSCDYLYTEPTFLETTESGKVHDYTATAHIKCTNAASPITISSATCKVTIGEQSLGGHVIITVTTATGDWDFRLTLTGIKYTVTEDGFGCPFGGTGAKTGATYTQGSAVTFDSTNGATIDVG